MVIFVVIIIVVIVIILIIIIVIVFFLRQWIWSDNEGLFKCRDCCTSVDCGCWVLLLEDGVWVVLWGEQLNGEHCMLTWLVLMSLLWLWISLLFLLLFVVWGELGVMGIRHGRSKVKELLLLLQMCEVSVLFEWWANVSGDVCVHAQLVMVLGLRGCRS